MKRTVFSLLTLLVAAGLGACSAASPVGQKTPADGSPGASLTVVPPYADPEFILRVSPPHPKEWVERRNVSEEGRPMSALRLTHVSDGATVDFAFAPASDWTPAYLLADIRQKEEKRGLRTIAVRNLTPERAEVVGGREGAKGVRIVVLQASGMTHGILVASLESPQTSYGANAVALDAMLDTLVVAITGPLTSEGEVAQCLSLKGAKLYSASWCGPCQNQLKRFGTATNRLQHYECSDKQGEERDFCRDAGIEMYPTWVFGDGSRLQGEYSLETLATHAGCPFPKP